MASKLGPEDTYTLMEQVLEILIHKVHDYGGTVNQLLGDGLYGNNKLLNRCVYLIDFILFGAKESTTEEPDAGKLHVRVCTGGFW